MLHDIIYFEFACAAFDLHSICCVCFCSILNSVFFCYARSKVAFVSNCSLIGASATRMHKTFSGICSLYVQNVCCTFNQENVVHALFVDCGEMRVNHDNAI